MDVIMGPESNEGLDCTSTPHCLRGAFGRERKGEGGGGGMNYGEDHCSGFNRGEVAMMCGCYRVDRLYERSAL